VKNTKKEEEQLQKEEEQLHVDQSQGEATRKSHWEKKKTFYHYRIEEAC
jgi:hypothetical protein